MKNELIDAVIENNEEKVKEIIDTKNVSLINFQDKAGFTALHYAVQDNNFNLVSILLNAGADFELPDMYGNTALIRAVSSFRGDERIIDLLLSKGADLNKKNNYGVSAIEGARNIVNYDIFSIFKKYLLC